MAGPPSIISSRMTDVNSDDEGNKEAQSSTNGNRRSQLESLSRPGTARTGLSSRTQNQPLRHALGKRTSAAASSIASGRPGSSLSRSHVPSLTSHAFFHPMSSQKLQAQRSGTRPTMLLRQQSRGDIELSRDGRSVTRQSVTSDFTNPQMMSRLAQSHSAYDNEPLRPPGSRGTEITDLDGGVDRVTANTSPTYGHYPTGSLSESVRPLQRKPGEGRNNSLTVRVDRNFKSRDNLPTPVRTPRSFRSSFMLPTRNGSPQTGVNRDIQGGEKLESVASTPQLSPADAVAATANDSNAEKMAVAVGRNFEFFEGNTVFCLGGRFQNTRSTPVNIATGSLVVIPSALWFAFSAPWLWDNVSPAVPITFGYLFYICISSFIHASVSDPGILPRNLHQFPPPDENEDPLRLGPPTTDWTLIRSAESSTSAMEVPTKYCRTCNIWRPPRTHHCRLCDNCIETADHHCVWLNNCVGRRNYRYFFAFVTSTTLLAIYLLASCLGQITTYASLENISVGQAIDHFRVPFALVIYGFLGFLYPAALMFYHIFLMARGETTREFLNSHKFLKKDRYRAFTQGNWVKNWIVVLCRPRPPTYYRFKETAVPGDQRLAARKRSELRRAETKEGMEMQDVGSASVGFQGPTSRAAAAA
ncbi:uncharacterized protein PpBr36_05658 [Pyricularia pennisetigena]|uniref:uncharacterized protein n=1 Tax=Pyricularia pennisetigena TaxID=1578925 RepID=UPI001150D3E4|nr:uncharacterized protein PpBr36_05658 [Pyricularia pennisetigena]TLS22835.1 hypothetical protein PpBr36_05658 [Pyricularia pennisetigena]